MAIVERIRRASQFLNNFAFECSEKKESAGKDFLSPFREMFAWKLSEWLLSLRLIPISTFLSLPLFLFPLSLVIFPLHYLFIFGKKQGSGFLRNGIKGHEIWRPQSFSNIFAYYALLQDCSEGLSVLFPPLFEPIFHEKSDKSGPDCQYLRAQD